MQVGIPKLYRGLMREPPLANEQAKDDTGSIFRSTSLLGGLDDLVGDDFAVRLGDEIFFELTGNTLLDQTAQADSDLGDLNRGNGRLDDAVMVAR